MGKKFIKVTSFLIAFAVAFAAMYYVFNFKYLDSSFKMTQFYKQEDNTVDVLVLGSSHSYQGINTAVLWNDYGYAAYDLCGAAQPLWNTYYYLEEALKTQTPKVILLDLFTLYYEDDYYDQSFSIKNTYGLKWSQTKIDAIKASFDETTAGKQYFFSILQYHTRYSDLNKTDFYPYQANKEMYENHKGFYTYFNTVEIKDNDLSDVTQLGAISDKNEMYLTKIIELAQSKNIPIITMVVPFQAEEYHQKFYNSAMLIADGYGVPFYNFLTEYKDDLGLDYSTDFSGTQHVNYLGSAKLTRYIGNILKNEYNIPNHHNDSAYASWQADAEVYYKQLENTNVPQIKTLTEYESVFSSDRYKIIVTENGYKYLSETSKSGIKNRNAIKNFFESIGVKDGSYANDGIWYFDCGEYTSYDNRLVDDNLETFELSKFDDAAVKNVEKKNNDDEKVTINGIFVNMEDKTTVANGINIMVYDTLTQTVIDSAGYNFSNSTFTHLTK